MARWNTTQEMRTAKLAQVFSGGACNILDANGNLIRNTERDAINDWLSAQDILFFDPQIHPDTHDMAYDYDIHHPIEVTARKAATVNLYEISPRTFGGVSSLEIAIDTFRWQEPMVLYYSDGNADRDDIPAHDKHGSPLFVPDAIGANPHVDAAHYREMRKNANNMRRYLMHYAGELNNLTVHFSGKPRAQDTIISLDRMHAADIFEAVVRASRGERVSVYFDGQDIRDDKGNPIFSAPDDPPPAELRALLDQYVDEGNQLRHRISQLVGVNVFTRIVYTHRSAIIALEELLTLTGILPRA